MYLTQCGLWTPYCVGNRHIASEKCWLITYNVNWHSYHGYCTRDTSVINHLNELENDLSNFQELQILGGPCIQGIVHTYALWLYLVDIPLQWRHNGRDGVSTHQSHDCLLNRLFKRRSKKTSKLRVTCLCEGNSPVTDEFPTQRASKAENVSIWWRHHALASQYPRWRIQWRKEVRPAVDWIIVRRPG